MGALCGQGPGSSFQAMIEHDFLTRVRKFSAEVRWQAQIDTPTALRPARGQ